MFTSGLYDPCIAEKYRYLIKHQGHWKRLDTYAKDPDWDDEVSDVIELASADRTDDRWRMKNGRRYLLRDPARVEDSELTLIMLQVEVVIG